MYPRALFVLALVLHSAARAQAPLTPEQLDLSLEAPALLTQPGPQYADEVRSGNMIIGVERTPKGRLWSCWVGNGDSPNGFFMLASSDDGGEHWSKPRLVIDPTDPPGLPQRRALVGNLWTDPAGRLWLFFDQSLGYFDGRGGDWYTRCDNPDADEPAWSAPVRFADGCTLNKPTVVANGDWLLPSALWTRDRIKPDVLKEAHHELDPIRMANVYASTDQGRTWTRRGGVAFPKTDFDEHMIVELRDSRLWMLARTKLGISESYSADQGRTWSEPQPSAIQNPSARFFIRRLASGNLLLVKNGPVGDRLPRRSSMTAFLSGDDGKTWGKGLLLDDRAEVSYPDGIQAPDGMIHLSYDWNRHTDAEILLAKFREEDVAAGKFITPGAKPRMLINKALAPHLPGSTKPDAKWAAQAVEDAKEDRQVFAYDGVTPNKMVCDTTLRKLPDKSWVLFMLAGGDKEPSPENYTGVTRSQDQGKTWSPLERFDVGFPREGATIGQGPTELMTLGTRSTLFFSTHSKHWANDWRSWFLTSDDSFKTWSKPVAVPGRLKERTFIRNHIVARDGRIIVPFQHYIGRRRHLERARGHPPHAGRSLFRLGREQPRRVGERAHRDDHPRGQTRRTALPRRVGRRRPHMAALRLGDCGSQSRQQGDALRLGEEHRGYVAQSEQLAPESTRPVDQLRRDEDLAVPARARRGVDGWSERAAQLPRRVRERGPTLPALRL
jgi:predicted neuraminidase